MLFVRKLNGEKVGRAGDDDYEIRPGAKSRVKASRRSGLHVTGLVIPGQWRAVHNTVTRHFRALGNRIFRAPFFGLYFQTKNSSDYTRKPIIERFWRQMLRQYLLREKARIPVKKRKEISVRILFYSRYKRIVVAARALLITLLILYSFTVIYVMFFSLGSGLIKYNIHIGDLNT